MKFAFYKVSDARGVERVEADTPEEIRRLMAMEDVYFHHPEAAVLFLVNCLCDRVSELEKKLSEKKK